MHLKPEKRFRQKRYAGCVPWQATSETFVERTEFPDPNHLDWVRGTYTAAVPISDGPPDQESGQESQILVPLTLHLDFTKGREENVHWTIDLRPSKTHKGDGAVAYPGIHSGYLSFLNLGSPYSGYEVFWETPLFSPYVEVVIPNRRMDQADWLPLTLKCRRNTNSGDIMKAAGHIENVFIGGRGYHCYVPVLQRILRDVSRLLVFGPRYENMQIVPLCPYDDLFESPGISTQRKAEFFGSPHFAAAARFFSRAFCRAGLAADESEEDPVPRARCEASVQAIEALFEHFTIVREPPWVENKNGDWVDDMEAEAAALKTMGQWLDFERKWAAAASYACMIELHEGPWAGDDWKLYVDVSAL
jgi:hypothetical protein